MYSTNETKSLRNLNAMIFFCFKVTLFLQPHTFTPVDKSEHSHHAGCVSSPEIKWSNDKNKVKNLWEMSRPQSVLTLQPLNHCSWYSELNTAGRVCKVPEDIQWLCFLSLCLFVHPMRSMHWQLDVIRIMVQVMQLKHLQDCDANSCVEVRWDYTPIHHPNTSTPSQDKCILHWHWTLVLHVKCRIKQKFLSLIC